MYLCAVNTCTCSGGVAGIGGTNFTCEVDGAEVCTACNQGYILTDQLCTGRSVLSKCSCQCGERISLFFLRMDTEKERETERKRERETERQGDRETERLRF